MPTLRSIGRGSVYLALAIFVIWLVIVLGGANRIPLISLPLHVNELVEFVLFFVFALALAVGALIQEHIRTVDESNTSP